MRHKTELERLQRVEAAQGREGAIAFAERVYGAYRAVLRHGFRMPGTMMRPNNRRGGRGLIMRRSLILSCLSFREFLREPCSENQ
jgi:hypothetical protein